MTRHRRASYSHALYFGLLIAWVVGVVPAYAEDTACQLKQAASLPAKIDNGRLLIRMQLDDHDVWMKVGTGEPQGEIAWQTASQLKLPFLELRENAVIDDAGKALRHYVKVHTVGLGDLKAHDIVFVVVGESNSAAPLQDGTFGADILTAYDVEFDLAHGKVNLYNPDHCPGKVVYWTENYFKIPFQLDHSLHAIFPVTLDGQQVRGSLDTASVGSTLTTAVAKQKFDIDPVGRGAKPDGQEMMSSGASLPFYLHRFGNFAIGDIAFHNTEFEIVPNSVNKALRNIEPNLGVPRLNPNQEMQMSIGLHHLARMRFYIAYGERMLYVSAADAN
jgi:hypothetical protein